MTEENVSDAVRQVRLSLLEADVNFAVVKDFINKVKEKALGEKVLKSVNPGQQFIKTIHDELLILLGGSPENEESFKQRFEPNQALLTLNKKPAVWLFCGLQGSGKTTHVAKVARYVKKYHKGKKVLIAACDLQRPKAVEQLKVLAAQVEVDAFESESQDPVLVAKLALEKAKAEHYDVLIVDTAGRLHVDEALMDELAAIKQAVEPDEVLFTAMAAMGASAAETVDQFHKRLGVSGIVLTMLDGDAKGGAVVSLVATSKQPILFEGVGEKMDDLQPFNPYSMSDRLLGMGDTVNLVRKAQEVISEEDSKRLENKLMSASFNYEDFLSQMQTMKKMGPISSLLKMLPGASQLSASMPGLENSDAEMKKTEAIILSMTPKERRLEVMLSHARRQRLARGSGNNLDTVNRLVKNFEKAKQFFKKMPKNMKQMQKMMGDLSCR